MRNPFVFVVVAFAADLFAAPCAPLESRAPNAADQRPAFEGQTRACPAKSQAAFDIAVVARGLEYPWAVEPLPNGGVLVTEKAGRLRIVGARGDVGEPIAGLPKVDARGQGGLLDVALGPAFQSDRTIYWSFTEPRKGGNGTSVARGVLSPDLRSVEQVSVIFRAMPTYDGTKHFGSRLAFGPDGMLYITLGDRADARMRPHAQQPDSHMGKVIRIPPDGGPAEIFSLGHRNIQAAAFDEKGRLWVVEHGTRGGDELNLVEKGRNYGWPIAAYGVEYSGRAIAGAQTQRPGTEQPVYYWDPVIAPSGAQFYSGTAFRPWRGNLFVGGLVSKSLVRLVIDGNRVSGEERLLADRGKRIRDVREARDGSLYVVTDEPDGELLKLTPRS